MKYWKFNPDIQVEKPECIPDITHIKKWYYSGILGFNGIDVARTGIYKIGGWAFDFRDEMKKFVVKFTDGDISEMWAPNKTSLRKSVSRKVKYILDIPRQYY